MTLRANLAAWQRWCLLPRVLRDVSTVDTRTTVLGTEVARPILVAPTAMHRFFCDEGELATARAAANVGTAFIVSMAATTSVEDVAAAAPTGLHWAQMYMLRDRGRTRALCERAREPATRRSSPRSTGRQWGAAAPEAARARCRPRSGCAIRTSRHPTTPRPPTSWRSSATSTRRSPSTTSRSSASGAVSPSW